jgi:predicted DNA-binding transcriptional regulator AlpA
MEVQKQQMIQVFQMSMDDLKELIKESVKSVITDSPNNNIDTSLAINNSYSENDILTREEVKKILKVSFPTLWKYNKNGTLKVKQKIGRRVYYSRIDLDHLLNNVA